MHKLLVDQITARRGNIMRAPLDHAGIFEIICVDLCSFQGFLPKVEQFMKLKNTKELIVYGKTIYF